MKMKNKYVSGVILVIARIALILAVLIPASAYGQSIPNVPVQIPPATVGESRDVRLEWKHVANESGRAVKFRVYYGRVSGVFQGAFDVDGTSPTFNNTVTINKLALGDWYFAVAAIVASGESSLLSETVKTTIHPRPSAPTDVKGTTVLITVTIN